MSNQLLLCFEERFGELGEDDLDIEIDERVLGGNKILHNICSSRFKKLGTT